MIKRSPPKWADRFLEWYCNPSLLEAIQGDAYELYDRTLRVRSKRVANFLFIWNVFAFSAGQTSNVLKHLHPLHL